jgi:hypothetical protein
VAKKHSVKKHVGQHAALLCGNLIDASGVLDIMDYLTAVDYGGDVSVLQYISAEKVNRAIHHAHIVEEYFSPTKPKKSSVKKLAA